MITHFRLSLTALALLTFATLARAADPSVFNAPPLPLTPVIRPNIPTPGGPLRQLTVAEHVGLARKNDLVRVPLFFHPGECNDPNALVLFDAADIAKASPIPYQPDDIRKSPDGQIAAMHLYFFADFSPWQRRQFSLYPGTNPAAKSAPIPMTEQANQVLFAADDLKIAFYTTGPRQGAITQFEAPFGKLDLLDGYLGPDLRLERQHAEPVKGKDDALSTVRTSAVSYKDPATLDIRAFACATGPLFAKVRVTLAPKNIPDAAEVTYLIPRHGSTLIATVRSFPNGPDDKDTTEVVGLTNPVLLSGRATLAGQAPTLTKIPTGLRKLLRDVQHQYVSAASSSDFSLINIPHISNGGGGIAYQSDEPIDAKSPARQTLELRGPDSLHRRAESNSATIRSFWFQNRIVLAPTADFETLWNIVRANQVTLTAAVDEPGITIDDLAAELKAECVKFTQKEDWHRTWYQNAGIDYLTGNEDAVKAAVAAAALPPKPRDKDLSKLETWLPGWALDQTGKLPPLDRPKGNDKVAGPVQPYDIGYGATPLVPLATYWGPSERLDKICYAVARASMLTNGTVYRDSNMPHLIAFANAYNMQIGSVFFGLYAGKKSHDDWMTLFYRDITRSPGTACIYGRGQRSYSGNTNQGGQSDLLYMGVCDHWLRSIELSQNEDLWTHPATYQRFTDSIDVTGDLQHRNLPTDSGRTLSYTRGNFFRTQSHDHRWEGWDAAPYMQMLENPADTTPVGLTEAWYFTHKLTQATWVNWADMVTFLHTLVDLQLARHNYAPPIAPALPKITAITPNPAGGVTVSWNAVPGIVSGGYRIYRAEKEGQITTLLNSPYVPERYKLLTATTYHDPAGDPAKFYFVTALTADGIESRWFPDEPLPIPGKNARKK